MPKTKIKQTIKPISSLKKLLLVSSLKYVGRRSYSKNTCSELRRTLIQSFRAFQIFLIKGKKRSFVSLKNW